MARTDGSGGTSKLVQAAAAFVLIFALRYAQEVLVPIALAVLFAFLLAPLAHKLERGKVPRGVAVLLVVVLAFGVLGGIGTIVARQLNELKENLPEYTTKVAGAINRFKSKGGIIADIRTAGEKIAKDTSATRPSSQPTAQADQRSIGDGVGEPAPVDDHVQKVQVVSQTPAGLGMIESAFGPILSVLATAFIVIVLCIFMLMSREDLRDRMIRLAGQGRLNVTTQAMDDAARRVSRYLLMQALTNGSYGVVVALGLLVIGVPGALLWGLLAALLRFIPYVGPWLGAAGPVLLAFVTKGAHHGFATIGLWVVLEIVVSSFVEPWLYGANTGVSAIAILVAAVFWAWVWGGVGLLLATPLTVVLVVLGKYVPQLEFFSILLGDEQVFDAPTRYYQRLLAADPEEAGEVIEEYLKKMPVEQVYETVMIPALGFAHRDRFRGRLDSERADFIRATMREEVKELGERPETTAALAQAIGVEKVKPTTYVEATNHAGNGASQEIVWSPLPRTNVTGAEGVQVVCLPARDEADELAGMMFAQVLTRSGFKAEAVGAAALASEMVELVGKLKADIVVVSALPPSAISHARYLCKRLHQAFPEVVLVVGLWTSHADLKEAREKITCTGKDVVVAAFSDGYRQVEQLVHPLVLTKGEANKSESAEDLAVNKRPSDPVVPEK